MTSKLMGLIAEIPPQCRRCLCLMKYVGMRKLSKYRTEFTYKCPKCGQERKEER